MLLSAFQESEIGRKEEALVDLGDPLYDSVVVRGEGGFIFND